VLQELEFYIGLYNSQLPAGQETVFDSEDKLFKGKGIRVITFPAAEKRHILVTLKSTRNVDNDEFSNDAFFHSFPFID
jgi:hypothetical protein